MPVARADLSRTRFRRDGKKISGFARECVGVACQRDARGEMCRIAVVARKARRQKKEIHGAAASAAESFGFAEISFASVLILAGTPPRVLGLLPLDC